LIGKKTSCAMFGLFCVFALSGTDAGMLKNAEAANLTAKTTLTVVNVTSFVDSSKSPSQVKDYKVTHKLWNVHYEPGWVKWDWSPKEGMSRWPYGSTSLTGRVWKIAPLDNGMTYYAVAWDYISNATTVKHRGPTTPSFWIGTMLSSLCDTNATCNARERTNIQFWEN